MDRWRFSDAPGGVGSLRQPLDIARELRHIRLRQQGTSPSPVFGFSALCAEKPNTIEIKYRSAEGRKASCISCVS
jgi:hypothetical protein